MEIKVLKFVSPNYNAPNNGLGGLGGSFNNGMRWENYYKDYTDKGRLYLDALKKYIIENDIVFGGDEHGCSDEGTPLFSDYTISIYTYRAWADLLAAVWSSALDMDFSYMDFYVSPTILE